MIKIKNLKQTCGACPSQWEFETFDNRMVYVRYRYGYLSVRLGEPNEGIDSAVGGFEFIGEFIGNCMDGVCDWADVKRRLSQLREETILSQMGV